MPARRLLVVGAGASYAEAEHLGIEPALRPPLMKDFAAKMWADYNPHALLTGFLAERGHQAGNDARQPFMALEQDPNSGVNVERFFEYAYHHRDFIVPGCEGFDPATEYDNLLLHGILSPLCFLLQMGVLSRGPEESPLPLAERVARRLSSADLVLNLNYDTLFELGAQRAGHALSFAPRPVAPGHLAISKPHGSMNLLVDLKAGRFGFSPTLYAGSIQPADGTRNYVGFVSPRFGKQYDQHPVAEAIIEATAPFEPSTVTFWGVGLTDSDHDLLALYRTWSRRSETVEFINPGRYDVERAARLVGRAVIHFADVAAWERGDGDMVKMMEDAG